MKVTPIFSSEDQDLIDSRWNVTGTNLRTGELLARRTIRNPYEPPPRQIQEFAHRIVMERIVARKLVKEEQVDHINHNALDNRRANLRIVDFRGNGQNRKYHQFRGTTFHKKCGKWQAQVHASGITHYLGLFDSRKSAANAATKRRKQLGFLENQR